MVNLACFSGGVKFVDFCRAGVGEVGSVEFCHIGTSGVAVFLEGVAQVVLPVVCFEGNVEYAAIFGLPLATTWA